MPLEPGSHLGPYEIVAPLGAGGMGKVYRARDPRLGREVAVKVLSEEAAGDPDRLRRFEAEARAASALNHPNILTVHEIGSSESGPYIVTELVKGTTLRQLLAGGALPIADAIGIAIQTAEGIAKAHEAGIVHRDLKPENIMVTSDRLVKILDFGLAKLVQPVDDVTASSLTATGAVLGTLGYMSPEQLRGLPADPRSDQFSLGVVLYEMLSGANPFRGRTAAERAGAILRDDPPPLAGTSPAIPKDLSQVVAKALAKAPEQRFGDVRQLAAELRRFPNGDQSTPGVGSPALAREHRLGSAWSWSLVATALAVVAAGFLLVRRPAGSGPADAVSLPPDRIAVAVLPVRDDSGNPELERAGIGRILGDAFVQILSDVPSFYVVSPLRLDGAARSLGRPFGEAGQDLGFARAVCERAKATAMLSGRLARLGETYVLNATLTEIPSERLLGTFRAESGAERLLSDLTRAVSADLARKYGASRSGGAGAGVEQVATGSVKAYAHFVRGHDLVAEGRWTDAVPELEAALAIDPEMGVAWSDLSCAHSFAGDDVNAKAAHKRAEELLGRVNGKERFWIETNGLWVTSGNGALYGRQIRKFIRDFPDDRDGYFYAGLAAEYLDGKCSEALAYYDQAYALTPVYYPVTKTIVDCELKLGRPDRAKSALDRFLALPAVSEHGRRQARGRLAALR